MAHGMAQGVGALPQTRRDDTWTLRMPCFSLPREVELTARFQLAHPILYHRPGSERSGLSTSVGACWYAVGFGCPC